MLRSEELLNHLRQPVNYSSSHTHCQPWTGIDFEQYHFRQIDFYQIKQRSVTTIVILCKQEGIYIRKKLDI
jgi:hypothetical protein